MWRSFRIVFLSERNELYFWIKRWTTVIPFIKFKLFTIEQFKSMKFNGTWTLKKT
jgi:hypothetical protein